MVARGLVCSFSLEVKLSFEALLDSARIDAHGQSLAFQADFLSRAPVSALRRWLYSSVAHPSELLEVVVSRADAMIGVTGSYVVDAFFAALGKFVSLEDFGKHPSCTFAFFHDLIKARTEIRTPLTVPSLRVAREGELGFAQAIEYVDTSDCRILSPSENERAFDALASHFGGGFKFFLRSFKSDFFLLLPFPGLQERLIALLPPARLSSTPWSPDLGATHAYFKRLRSFGASDTAWDLWLHAFKTFPAGSLTERDTSFFFKTFLPRLTGETLSIFDWWSNPSAFSFTPETFALYAGDPTSLEASLNAHVKVHAQSSEAPGVFELAEIESQIIAQEEKAARTAMLANADHSEALALNLSLTSSEQELLRAFGSNLTLPLSLPSRESAASERLSELIVTDAWSGEGEPFDLLSILKNRFYTDRLTGHVSGVPGNSYRLLDFEDDASLFESLTSWLKGRDSISPSFALWLLVCTFPLHSPDLAWASSHAGRRTQALSLDAIKRSDTVLKKTAHMLGFFSSLPLPLRGSEEFAALIIEKAGLGNLYASFKAFDPLVENIFSNCPPVVTSSEELVAGWGFMPLSFVAKHCKQSDQLLGALFDAGGSTFDTTLSLFDDFSGSLTEFLSVISYLGPEPSPLT